MKTVVYLDILLVTNFIAGYFLLRAAARLAGMHCTPLRILLGAGTAAASTLILLAPAMAPAAGLAYKLASAVLVTLAAFGWPGPRAFFRAGTWFFLLNLGLAGFALLGVQRGEMQGMRVHNLTVYVNLSPFTLMLCVLGVYLVVRLVLLLFGVPGGAAPWQLTLALAGRELRLQALYDTGFFLRDPLGGRQTILISWPAVRSQLPQEINDFLLAYFQGNYPTPPSGVAFRLVPCSAALGKAALPGLVAAAALLHQENRTLRADRVIAVFSPEPIQDGQFQALFGREFILDETERRREPCR